MIFISGATGNIGRAVMEGLALAKVEFRCGQRASDGAAAANAGGDTVQFDFLKPQTFEAAAQGCSGIFLLRPPAIANTRDTLNAFIDIARHQGVTQVVFVSVAGAGSNPLVPHHAVEQHLRSGPSGWTILRPTFFAQNFGAAYRQDIVQDSRIYFPAGQAKVAFVDTRDIAEVAIRALLNPTAHRDQIYHLTGPDAVTFAQAAAFLSVATGRPIAYQPASAPGYFLHLTHRGLPLAQALIQTVLHLGLRFGQAAMVNEQLPHLLQHDSFSLKTYFQDHRQLWEKWSAAPAP